MRSIGTLTMVLLFVYIVSSGRPHRSCVDLVIDDTTCEGDRSNFPRKICALTFIEQYNSSSLYCDDQQYFAVWRTLCPLQNRNITQFCDGTGYSYIDRVAPCLLLYECQNDEDCNYVDAPQAAPLPEFKPACFGCCQFCYNASVCQKSSSYTHSSDCTPCPLLPTTSQSPVTQTDTPVGSPIPRPNANNQEDSDDLEIAPWIYAVGFTAFVAFLVLLFVLLFRHKCSKTAPRSYEKLEEHDANTIDVDD